MELATAPDCLRRANLKGACTLVKFVSSDLLQACVRRWHEIICAQDCEGTREPSWWQGRS